MDFAATIDPKSLGRIAVLMGGFSSERKVSLSSGSGVLKALQEAGCDAHKVDPAETDLMTLRGQYDRAVISLHGRFGEDGCVHRHVFLWHFDDHPGGGTTIPHH